MEGLMHTGAYVNVISQDSWNPAQPHQRISILHLGIGTLPQIKQCVDGLEGQVGKINPYMTYKAINIWEKVLFQQWEAQLSTDPTSETC